MADHYAVLRAARRTPGAGYASWTADDGTVMMLLSPRRASFGWWKFVYYDTARRERVGLRIDPHWAGTYSKSQRAMFKRIFHERISIGKE